jgi:hypothetical protein
VPGQRLLIKTETGHNLTLLVLQMHHYVLDLDEPAGCLTHVLRHTGESHLFWETLSAFSLMLACNGESLRFNVICNQSKDFLDVLYIKVSKVNLTFQFVDFCMNVELWKLLLDL